jgi:hypothetical protein
MTGLFAQVPIPIHFWNAPAWSSQLYFKIAVALVAGFAVFFALLYAPPRVRRPVVIGVTFFGGLFYVVNWLYPVPIMREPGELPRPGHPEVVGFFMQDALPIVGNFANVLAALLFGLGIYSVLRIHLRRFLKKQADWPFSLLLIFSMITMVVFGLWDWSMRQEPEGPRLELVENWEVPQYMRDFLFDGLLQQMDAVMFSMIAFFILSAAYRAFRIRSVEATILLGTALIVILSLMGMVTFYSDQLIAGITGGHTDHIANDFSLFAISSWLRDTVQTSSLRAIDFGIGVGALAMSLRIWLSLERGAITGS